MKDMVVFSKRIMEKRGLISQAAKQPVSENTLCSHGRICMPVNVPAQLDEAYNTY
jgi:hypothetical protein